MNSGEIRLPTLFQEYMHLSRYAKWNEKEGRREFWGETVDRYVDYMCDNRLAGKIPVDIRASLREAILKLNVLPSMRCLMTAGRALDQNDIAAYNCSYISIDHPHAFDEVLLVLMNGTGVGFSVERQLIVSLPSIPEKLKKSNTVIGVDDSKEGWAQAFRELISMLYAGVVPKWDLSKVRPAGAKLKTFGGRASGPEPLNDLFNFTVATFTGAAGRKLNSLECHDLCCKTAEAVIVGGVRRSACISLSNPSDDRMRHAKSGEWWSTAPHRMLANNSACYTEKPQVDAFMREWLALYESKSGERGIFNRAAATKQAAKSGRRKTDFSFGCNPCLPDYSWTLTADGPKQISDLIDTPFDAIINGSVYRCETGFFKTGEKEVFAVKTDRGYEFEATGNHPVLVEKSRKTVYKHHPSPNSNNKYKCGVKQDLEWKNTEDLVPGDKIVISDNNGFSWGTNGEEELGWIVGEVVGDGGYNPEKYDGYVRFWGDDAEEMANRAADIVRRRLSPGPQFKGASGGSDVGKWQVSTMAITKLCDGLIAPATKDILPALEKKSASFVRGFISGFFDADGCPQGNVAKGRSVRLGQANREKLVIVQRMLARLGIASTVSGIRLESGMRMLPDGRGGEKEYMCKDMYELIIGRDCIDRFAEFVGFTEPGKVERLVDLCDSRVKTVYDDTFTTTVVSVVKGDKAIPVYDATVNDIHCFDCNGIVVHNCSEIIMRSNSFCNLTEVVIRSNDTEATLMEKVKLATIMGTMQATLTNFNYLRPVWKQNCEEEALLGISMTGIYDNPLTYGVDGKRKLGEMLTRLREYAIVVNKEWSALLGVNQSVALSCVKPSGSVSQLVNCSSGIHPRHSQYYIRTVRADKKDPMAKMMVDMGFPVEDDVVKPEYTYVFSFPIASPDKAVLRDDVTALDHLELWKVYQDHWCEHKPSITVNVREHEWLDVGAWVYKHFDSVSGIAFLPFSNHSYRQAPYQDVSKEEYEALLAKMPVNVDWSKLREYEKEDRTTTGKTYACSGDHCELVDMESAK